MTTTLRWIGCAGFALLVAGCDVSSPASSGGAGQAAPSRASSWFNPANAYKNPQALALARAAQDNNATEVQHLIKDEHIDPDVLFSDGRHRVPVVAWPVITHSLGGLKALLDNGANPNVKMRYPDLDKSTVYYYNNAMVYAAMSEDPAYLKLLLQHGGDPNTKNVNDETLLFQAFIWHNQWQNVQVLVEHGADINAVTQARSILGDYTERGDFKKAYWLLQHGADPKAQGMYGVKPGDVILYHSVDDIFWYPAKPDFIESQRQCQQWLLAHGFQRPPMSTYYRDLRKAVGAPTEEKDIPLL
jgi:uncharacterized protein